MWSSDASSPTSALATNGAGVSGPPPSETGPSLSAGVSRLQTAYSGASDGVESAGASVPNSGSSVGVGPSSDSVESSVHPATPTASTDARKVRLLEDILQVRCTVQ